MTARDQILEGDVAEKLAYRLRCAGVDVARADEAEREPDDRPPKFANALMNPATESRAEARNLTEGEWNLVCDALEHYATIRKE